VIAPEDVAEDLDAYLLPRPGVVREDRGYAVLVDGPDPTPLNRFASRLRLSLDPRSEVDAIRGWFRARGKEAFTWKLGQHTLPSHLESVLRAHGAHPDAAEPDHTAMVLDAEPPAVEGIDVCVVESLEEYTQSAEIMFVGFGGSFSEDEISAMRAAVPQRFEAYRDDPTSRRYLAYRNGKPVAMATAIRTSVGVVALGGGATLPEARGQGAYRALVHARWLEAVRWGASALVTQASGMSRPILESIGFRAVSPVLELIDTSD
jgi:GNAT superfamily N-acetyltransferase